MPRFFQQHDFKETVTPCFAVPKIYLTPVAFSKIGHMVDHAPKEVGWLGTVAKLDSGDYLIEDVWLLEQEVSHSETDITEDGVAKLAEEILAAFPDEGVDMANRLFYWGHSHVNLGTSPSGQDVSQMKLFYDNECPFFIRGIHNKKGRMEFTLFAWDEGFTIADAAWEIYYPEMEDYSDYVKAEYEAKVTETKWTSTYKGGSGYQGGKGKGTGKGGSQFGNPHASAGVQRAIGFIEGDDDDDDLGSTGGDGTAEGKKKESVSGRGVVVPAPVEEARRLTA